MMTALRSFESLSPKKRSLWKAIRPLVPQPQRRFFEGFLGVPGQLWYAERKLLYRTIRHHRPSIVFEVGTWLGGGSTFFIAQALHDNRRGILHTVEASSELYQRAIESYHARLPELLPRVCFHEGASTDIYPALLREIGRVDALFLDGAQDAEQTMDEFRMFAPFLQGSSILLAHDWDNEKMRLLRREIEGSREWKLEQRLTWPESVGLAAYSKIDAT